MFYEIDILEVKDHVMFRPLTYRQKRFIIEFVAYGLPFTLLMWVMNLEKFTIGWFLFHFIFYGAFMAFFMRALENRSLKKTGVHIDSNTMNEYQKRELLTSLTEKEFYDFWNNSEIYTITQIADGSLDVNRRYYTSEFKETINIQYQANPSPRMIFRSKPQRWFGNNITAIHKTIDSVKIYAENNMYTMG